MDKRIVFMRAFNQHFVEFLHDVGSIFPDNRDIGTSLTSLETIKRANPALVPRIWYKYIYVPYQEKIDAGDIAFFFDKNYAEDLSHLSNADKVMMIIDKIRTPVSSMNDTNREHTIKYIQNLSLLSARYMETDQ
jgi:hypothetical protein